MAKKLQPAVLKLNFVFQKYSPPKESGEPGVTQNIPSGEFATRFIDLSQVASIVNRRFYRQGLNWAVSQFKLITPNNCQIVIQKLPNSWVMSNAWEKGFRHWMKMNKEALESSQSVKPKFLDFKIYADEQHHQLGYDGNLMPVSLQYDTVGQVVTSHTATPGEWDSSKFVIPTATAGGQGNASNREVIAVGRNYPGLGASGLDAVSLIEGYAASRGLPNIVDPNTPDDAADVDGFNPDNWIAATFNDGTEQTEEVILDMITENTQSPYPFENDGIHTDTMYPGGANQLPCLEIHEQSTVTSTSVGGMTVLPGGNFPCGLIAVTVVNTSDSAIGPGFEVTLVPGNHRGYLAESMTGM